VRRFRNGVRSESQQARAVFSAGSAGARIMGPTTNADNPNITANTRRPIAGAHRLEAAPQPQKKWDRQNEAEETKRKPCRRGRLSARLWPADRCDVARAAPVPPPSRWRPRLRARRSAAGHPGPQLRLPALGRSPLLFLSALSPSCCDRSMIATHTLETKLIACRAGWPHSAGCQNCRLRRFQYCRASPGGGAVECLIAGLPDIAIRRQQPEITRCGH
jgi:hypothetical protein